MHVKFLFGRNMLTKKNRFEKYKAFAENTDTTLVKLWNIGKG